MTGHSEQLNELAAALAKAQAELDTAAADAVGHVGTATNGRSYRYATLASVWLAIRKPLTAQGLAVTQTCEPSNRSELRLTTTLLHQSGQWISGTEIVPMPVQTPQGYGSALTYARRYGLAAIVGVCVDDDDDAVAASQPPAPQQFLPQERQLLPRVKGPTRMCRLGKPADGETLPQASHAKHGASCPTTELERLS